MAKIKLRLGMRQLSPSPTPAIPDKSDAQRVDQDQRRDEEIPAESN